MRSLGFVTLIASHFCALHRAGRSLWQGKSVLDAGWPDGAFWRRRPPPSLETITTLFKLKDFI
jgi:hypothetical protein